MSVDKKISTRLSIAYNGVSEADENQTQQLLWQATMAAGDTIIIKYVFDAPDVSPEFYLLGPMEFYE